MPYTVPQKDQLSQKSGIQKVTPQYSAQATLQYKTFIKRTLVEALQNAFALYADDTLHKTKIDVNYQMTRADFPCIVIKYYEQGLKNAGVGHTEWNTSSELETLKATGEVALNGEVSGLDDTEYLFAGKTTVKGKYIPKGTVVKHIIDDSRILLSLNPTKAGSESLTFTDVFMDKFIPYHHYIYHGDISFEVYGLNSPDRDLVSDAIIEIVSMGVVGEEGQTFQNRLYATIAAENFPYSSWHFPVINTDLMTGYGEQQQIANWMPEDVFVYKSEYRVPIMGEFYSLTPGTSEGALELIKKVDIYPWDLADPYDTPPADFPEGIIPTQDYLPITQRLKKGETTSLPEGGEGEVFILPNNKQGIQNEVNFARLSNKVTVTKGAHTEELPW